MKQPKLTHEEVLVVDKVIDEAKIPDLEFYEGKTGRQCFIDTELYERGDRMTVLEGLEFICDIACNDDWDVLFGLTGSEKRTWDKMIDRLGLKYGHTSSYTPRVKSELIPARKTFNERTALSNTAEMESALFAALNKIGRVISVDRTAHGYIVTTKDSDFALDVKITQV